MIDHLESKFVMTFLMGLNESFRQIRAQILLINPLPAIDQVFSLVAQEEYQRTVGHLPPSIESITLLAASKDHKPQNSSGLGGHYRRKEEQRPICTHCGG